MILEPYLRLVRAWRHIQRALKQRQAEWVAKPNVVGFGVGPKYVQGVRVSDMAAVFFVTKKVPRHLLKPKDRLPSTILVGHRHVPTDVFKVGPLTKMQQVDGLPNAAVNDQRTRPVVMGHSIGRCPHEQDVEEECGTAGAVVQDQHGARFILTAGHVLKTNGYDVIQPSNHHGTPPGHNGVPSPPGAPPAPKDRIGETLPGQVSTGAVDAGIFEAAGTPTIEHIGDYRQPLPPAPTLTCQKSGAITGLTYGTIEFVGVTAFNDFLRKQGVPPPALATARDGLFFVKDNCGDKAFAMPGDSGSLIVVGWLNTSPGSRPDLGSQVENILSNLASMPSGQQSVKNTRAAMDRASLGLLIEAVPIAIPAAPGKGNIFPLFVVGQEIQMGLDAFNVTLVTN